MRNGEKLRELFERACELPVAERRGFVEVACDGDRELQRELLALLEVDAHAEASRGTAAIGRRVAAVAADAASSVTAPRLPERIAGFRIIERLGEGGMGVVYRAEQFEPIRREVALKLVRGGLDSASVVARFEIERQALALMDHPNVARVFEAGSTEDGLPYFAMELVRGLPITGYCASRNLSTDDRLRLYLQVCAGVQHAHHRGIIHRDLKPSNILVTDGERPVPKIIDFGIAKAVADKLTERTLATCAGTAVGTLDYMSPEQARGRSTEVDLRSDVYSLGVVLFELLSGKLPRDIAGLSAAEAQHRIHETAPRRLGSVNRALRGDLETIVAKALEEDRTRRYPSPGALAGDIERYLVGRPILARPPSVAYQARKLIARHKIRSVLLGSLLIAVTTGIVIDVAARRRAARETAISGAVSRLLFDMFQSADPLGGHGPDLTVRELLDRFDERAVEGLAATPEVEYRVRFWLAQAYTRLGAFVKARRQFLRCEELLRGLHGAESAQLAVHQIFLGWNLHELTRYEEAALRFRRAMAALESDRLAYGLAHARAQLGLADVLSHFGEYDTARDHALEALHAFTEDEPWHPDTGQLFVILAVIEKSAGNLDAAETYTRRAIAFESSGESRAYGIGPLAVRELGEIQLGQGECAAAERLMREQLETIEPLYPRGHASLLLARSLLGESLLCMGRYDDAREVLLRVDPTAAGFAFLDDEEQAAALDRLIRVHEALGRPDEAERYRRLARAAAAGLNASSSPQ